MRTPTFLELLIPQLQAPLFTIALDEWGTGTWDFGHVDASKYAGSLRTVPVDDGCATGGSWKVSGIGALFPEGRMEPGNSCGMFGRTHFPFPFPFPFPLPSPLPSPIPHSPFFSLPPRHQNSQLTSAISDTGWDLLNLDPTLVARYYASVPGATSDLNPGTWIFPCSAALPDLVLSIGGVDGVVIEGRWLNYHPWDGGGGCELTVFCSSRLFLEFGEGRTFGGVGVRQSFSLEVTDCFSFSLSFLLHFASFTVCGSVPS